MTGDEVLEAGPIRLEPVTPAHAHGLFEAASASRAELLPWMPWARTITVEGNQHLTHESMQNRLWDRAFHWAMVEAYSGLVLGVAGLNREGAGTVELHYWVRSDRTGRGYATAAARALVEYAFSVLGVERVTLWAGVENRASRRVAEKVGFTEVGPLETEPEGGLGPFPAVRYEIRR